MGPAARADPQSFDRLAVDYDRYASLEPPLVLEWLLAQLPSRGRRALDAGCGSGRHTLALADRFEEIVGIDLSQPLIDLARRQRPPPPGSLPGRGPAGHHRSRSVRSGVELHHPARHARPGGGPAPPARAGGQWGTAILADNVAARPTPPGLVYWFGAVREFPPTYAATAGSRRGWLLKFRISTAWLDHLASDRYLSRQVFQQRYGAVFPGAQFYRLGYAHAAVWHNPHNHQAVLQHGPRRRVAPCDRLEPLKQTSCAAGRAQGGIALGWPRRQ